MFLCVFWSSIGNLVLILATLTLRQDQEGEWVIFSEKYIPQKIEMALISRNVCVNLLSIFLMLILLDSGYAGTWESGGSALKYKVDTDIGKITTFLIYILLILFFTFYSVGTL